MASEAKIGLLLGLGIIFVIAFVLNELPRFGDAAGGSPPNESKFDDSPGIGAVERDHLVMNGTTKPNNSERRAPAPPDNNEDSRTSYAVVPITPPADPEPTADKTPTLEAMKRTAAKVYYTVTEGDNLAEIAKKFYGPVEGNKRINVLRIFEVNREMLKSPNEIRIGQNLVIPRLTSSRSDDVTTESIFPNWMFEKVESIGKRHLTAESPKSGQNRQYVVREGDNLWRVAEAQLGDATRYKEISRMNAAILNDEDSIPVGMRLLLPAQ